MKVDIPLPAGPEVELYKLRIKNKAFAYKNLEALLKKVEADLDKVCDVLRKSEEISLVFYKVLGHTTDKYESLAIMDGGFNLSVEEAKKFSIPHFQERYKSEMARILEKFRKFRNDDDYRRPVDLRVLMTGFRDSITVGVEAMDPYSPQ